jgi:hypothetical protein
VRRPRLELGTFTNPSLACASPAEDPTLDSLCTDLFLLKVRYVDVLDAYRHGERRGRWLDQDQRLAYESQCMSDEHAITALSRSLSDDAAASTPKRRSSIETRQSDATEAIEKHAPHLGFLLSPYELRVYWFEVFDSIRKLCLVGIPVFFVQYPLDQLALGLIVCFITV